MKHLRNQLDARGHLMTRARVPRKARIRRPIALVLTGLMLPLASLLAVATPAFASGSTYYPSVNLVIYDLTTGGYAGGGGYLTVNYNDELDFVSCLDSGDGSQGNHSLGINDSNGWWGAGGIEYGQDGCYSATVNWSWFGGDTFTSSFGGCSNCGGGNTLEPATSNWVDVILNGDLSWTAASGGGTVNYGTGINDPWGASSAYGAPVGLSYSGSAPSGVGWTGGGFSGTADQDGGFGGTVTATEYGSSGTSSSISAGWGMQANPVPPGWTAAPSGRTVIVGQGGWSDGFSVSSAPNSSFGVASGSLPPGVGLTDYGNNTAAISGAASQSGSYTATVYASNPGGTIYQNYTMTVDQVPVINSASSTTFTAGSAASFGATVAAGTYPTASFSESGTLPIGVSFSTNGVLSGTPETGAAGSYPLTIDATDAAGTGSQSFTLTVSEPASYTGQTITATGTGTAGTSVNGTGVLTAEADGPSGVLVDSTGDRFIVDTGANLIQEIPSRNTTAYGVTMSASEVWDIAGNGVSGYTGDDASGYAAELKHPGAIALDASGNLWIADTGNNVVRVLAGHNGTILGQAVSAGDIYTFIGTGTPGYHGDTGPAAQAKLDAPGGIAVDSSGDIFIADSGNNVIREVAASNAGSLLLGDIYTVAGIGSPGSFTSGAVATSAALDDPTSIAFGPDGNLYVADTGANVIGLYATTTGTVFGQSVTLGHFYDLAGNGTAGTSGNGGAAVGALVDHPSGLELDSAGDLYFADPSEGDLRAIAASGTGSLFGLTTTTGDVYQLQSGLTNPVGVGVDPTGALYSAESSLNKVALLGTASAITSASRTTFTANALGSFTVTGTGQPAPSFRESGSLPSGVTLAASGVLSGTPALGSAGTYPITVRASNGVGSVPSQSFTLTVDAAHTSLAVSANPSSPVIAQPATITVAVAPIPDGGTTMAITDAKGWFDCASAPVSSTTGLATCASSATINSTTSDLVSASFVGDSQYESSLGNLTITPTPAPTTVSLSAIPRTPTALTMTTLSATVSPVPDGGSVAFSDTNGYVSGCGAVAINTTTGVAACSTQTLSLPGLDTFSATYGGDANYLTSATASLPITVGRAVTSIVITTNPSTLTVDTPGTFIATVTGPDGPVTTGSVAFGDTQGSIVAGDDCGATTLNLSGVAQCGVANVASVNNDTITAAYSGSSLYAPITANAQIAPNERTTSLQLGISTTAFVVGKTSTLTVTLNQPAITGTVSFSDTSDLISGCGTVNVDPTTSTATCVTAAPTTTGNDSITVSYSGDSNDTAVGETVGVPIDSEPSLTSSTSLGAVVGQAFSSTVTTGGSPTVTAIAINGGSLPPGLSLADNHDGTATISGTLSPGGGGNYAIGLALNDVVLASVTDNLAFTVDQTPAFTTSSSATCVAQSACDISVGTSGYPNAHLGEPTALPSGLQFLDNGDGTADIVGTAALSDVGTVNFVISASNGVGAVTQHFTLTVSSPPAPPSTPSSNPTPSPGSGSGSSGSGAGSGGNSSSQTSQPLVLSSYAVKALLSGAMKATVTCSGPTSSVHESAKNGSLNELGFSLSCKAAGHKATLSGSLTSRTEVKKQKLKKGSVKRTDVTVWVGAIQFAEPAQHLSLTLSPTKAAINNKLVLTSNATGKMMVDHARRPCALSMTITPKYTT